MGKKIVYTSDDGATVVQSLSAEASQDPAKAARRLGLHDVSYVVIDDANAPSTEFGIGAWKKQGSTVVLDMDAARTAHMAEIRRARDEELRALDIDWMKAMDAGKTVEAAAIGQKRQALREIPQKFNMNSASNAAELAEMWPDDLADRRPARPGNGNGRGGGGNGNGGGQGGGNGGGNGR